MIVRKQTVCFDANRTPIPRGVRVGYESDHLAERLIFELPQVDEAQSAALMLDGEYADMALLEQDADGRYFVDLTADMLGEGGAVDCYVQIRGSDGTVWNSGVLRMRVGELPDVSDELMERCPTVVEQVMQSAQSAQEAARRAENAAESLKEAVQIKDDEISSQSTWSSAEIVERLCPPFEESGQAVACYPMEGYPLSVVSQIDPVQEGSGDPSPDNVRTIRGIDAIVLEHRGAEETVHTHRASLGRTVYGGRLDWDSRMLTSRWRLMELTGDEIGIDGKPWIKYEMSNNLPGEYFYLAIGAKGTVIDGHVVSSHFPQAHIASSTRNCGVQVVNSTAAGCVRLLFRPDMSVFTSMELWIAWLKAQYAAGTPVTVAYEVTKADEIQLAESAIEGGAITAMCGENVLISSTGNTTVKGRSDPTWVIGMLTERMAASVSGN